jgi:hypothetical protein
MSPYAFDVFLSYSHEDRSFAREIANWLRSANFSVWLDEEQLVPGARFRPALQQGLRESRHLIALLTLSYARRRWTHRELDLFDLVGDDEDRKIIGMQLEDLGENPLDQAFLVNHRIHWSGFHFDPEAFWLTNCALRSERPGPQGQWAQRGQTIVLPKQPHRVDTAPESQIRSSDDSSVDDSDLVHSFKALQTRLKREKPFAINEAISANWLYAKTSTAALIALAALPRITNPQSVWSFVDLGELSLARWYLAATELQSQAKETESWFSWAIAEENWSSLKAAADRAPKPIRAHMKWIEDNLTKRKSFARFEESYDYGVMITPWNHLHLTWTALRLRDRSAALAHAEALSRLANADLRARRFVVRLANWSVFAPIAKSGSLKVTLDQLCRGFENDIIPETPVRLKMPPITRAAFRRVRDQLWGLTCR